MVFYSLVPKLNISKVTVKTRLENIAFTDRKLIFFADISAKKNFSGRKFGKR